MAPALSIVIVNWNAADELRRCLTALRREPHDEVELIVVDNGSTDDSLHVTRKAWPDAVVVALPENVGFADGCNRGIAASRAPWVLTLNNDTEVRPGFLRIVKEAVASAPDDVGMIQPRILLRGRGRLNSTGVLVHKDGSAHDRDFDAPLDARREPGEVLCITAGAGLYRRRMLEETRLRDGYFDPSFFMYFEDVDVGWRCRLAGWNASYMPDASVEHAFQASSRRKGKHFVTTQCMLNRVRTLGKNASVRMILRSLPRTASELLWLLQHGGGTALARWLRAVGGALRQRGWVTELARVDRRTLELRWMRSKAG